MGRNVEVPYDEEQLSADAAEIGVALARDGQQVTFAAVSMPREAFEEETLMDHIVDPNPESGV